MKWDEVTPWFAPLVFWSAWRWSLVGGGGSSCYPVSRRCKDGLTGEKVRPPQAWTEGNDRTTHQVSAGYGFLVLQQVGQLVEQPQSRGFGAAIIWLGYQQNEMTRQGGIPAIVSFLVGERRHAMSLWKSAYWEERR